MSSWRPERIDCACGGCSREPPSPNRGRFARESIETQTDVAMQRALDVLGGAAEQLLSIIEPWGTAILEAGGYLTPLVRFTFDRRAPR